MLGSFRSLREKALKVSSLASDSLFLRALSSAAAETSSSVPLGSSVAGDAPAEERTWINRPGPVRFINLPKSILPRDLTEMLSAAGIPETEQRGSIFFEYDFRGKGIPMLKAAWFNPGGGPQGNEKRQRALKLNDSILSSQQISAASFSMYDFEERTRYSKLLRRSIWIDCLPDRFTTADLAMLFQGYDLLPFEAIVIRSKSEFGFTAPESHRVGIVRFRSEEEAMLAFREMSPRLRCLHTAEGEYNKILLMH